MQYTNLWMEESAKKILIKSKINLMKRSKYIGIERSDAVTIPIIALSANAFIDDIQESLDSGMNDHISKPINMEEVTDTIAKYIKDDTCLEKELKQKQNDR